VHLQSENKALKDRLAKLESENDNQSQYTRRDNLLFTGLPAATAAEIAASAVGHPTAESSESVVNKVITFCHEHLNVNIERSDISVAHRLKSNRTM
jgi:hypothetical protein